MSRETISETRTGTREKGRGRSARGEKEYESREHPVLTDFASADSDGGRKGASEGALLLRIHFVCERTNEREKERRRSLTHNRQVKSARLGERESKHRLRSREREKGRR